MVRTSLRALLVVGFATAGAVTPTSAQWRFEAQGGRLSYANAPETSTSVSVGLRHLTPSSDYGINAGLPFAQEDPIWAAAHARGRFASGAPLAVGIDLAGSAFGYRVDPVDSLSLPRLTTDDSYMGWGASVEAMPLVTWTGDRFGVDGRAGGLLFSSGADGAESLNRRALIVDGGLRAFPVSSLILAAEARWVRVTEGGYPFAGLRLTWAPSYAVWGSVGRWLDDSLDGIAWSAGASFPIGPRASLLLSGRRDPFDPVYATPARTSVGGGFSIRLGDVASTLPEPVPAAYENGIATIRLDAHDARGGTPSIAGDFNDWTAAPMTRRDGAWVYSVRLQPGTYNYSFLDSNGRWFVPENTPGRRDDGMGGYVAVLVVQ